MTITNWTNADLAHLTSRAAQLTMTETYVEVQQYCNCCSVVPVAEGDVYCKRCAQDISDYLFAVYTQEGSVDDDAETWQAQIAVDGGLY